MLSNNIVQYVQYRCSTSAAEDTTNKSRTSGFIPDFAVSGNDVIPQIVYFSWTKNNQNVKGNPSALTALCIYVQRLSMTTSPRGENLNRPSNNCRPMPKSLCWLSMVAFTNLPGWLSRQQKKMLWKKNRYEYIYVYVDILYLHIYIHTYIYIYV